MEGARAVLSCASCRQRKLKCDRNQPCSNCLARDAECTYASGRRGRGFPQSRGGNPQLEDRIRRLEQLISTMASQTPQQAESNSASSNKQKASSNATSSYSDPAELLEIKPGRMMASDNQTTYVSGTHWAALCNEVAELREGFDRGILVDNSELVEHLPYGAGPMLLEGLQGTPDIENILSDVPPMSVASRLVSRYFSSNEISSVILHGPTFEQEYTRFWLDPQQASPAWIGLLFGVMTIGLFLFMRSQEDLPGDLGKPMDVLEVFHRRSTECLVLSKYSAAPGSYTMETLILNAQVEFIRRRDANLGVWVLGGIIIRIALRMGYHRDPAHHPQLSVFQGEMRRRLWGLVFQLDALTSCQIGLPPMIQEQQCDTQVPHNLRDEDFGPDSAQLPSSRPETELTPVLYVIAKARLSSIFRKIFNQVSLGRIEDYDHIMDLDQRLEKERRAIPPSFHMASLHVSVIVPPHLLMRRYNLELLGLKARCILHRHHMTKSCTDAKYAFSRTACVEAAMAILNHQADIMKEVQDGGRLHLHRWFVNSLELHDFLLASMVVCLEIGFRTRVQSSLRPDDEQTPPQFSLHELIAALQNSRTFLDELKPNSDDARKVSNVLSVMLHKFSENSALQQDQGVSITEALEGNSVSSFFSDAFGLHNSLGSTGFDPSQLHSEPAPHARFDPTLEGVESFLNIPGIVGWDQWDAFVQDSRTTE
ncbi:fungal-specific transcription factor domain-containing protein [Dactylonectria estremocensis]|uniref:Fungal-specific transcription factor domain-containing protein n=1 Tax=Dactylonectria estremocensis TaxID=1079267 RepID=A0A9P9JAF6_9HYPO|nr:fungal-specific transcription factor domain-containing protein [Dactylonectria estremocensis]